MSDSNEVSQPILYSPFREPECFWYLREGETPQKRDGRRPSFVFEPRDQRVPWTTDGRILGPSALYTGAHELVMVNLIRDRLKTWEDSGYAGATRTTTELLTYWQDEGQRSGSFMRNWKPRRRSSFSPRLARTFSRGYRCLGMNPVQSERAMDTLASFDMPARWQPGRARQQ